MSGEDSIRQQVGEFRAAGVRTFLLIPSPRADRVEHVRTPAGIVAPEPVHLAEAGA